MFRADLIHDDDPHVQQVGVRAYMVLLETVDALCKAERLDVDVDEAAKLCWASMQGLLVLHPSMVHLDLLAGRDPVPRETLVVRFTQLVLDGLRAHPRPPTKR